MSRCAPRVESQRSCGGSLRAIRSEDRNISRDYTPEAVNSNFSDCPTGLLSLGHKAVSDSLNSVKADDVAFRADS